MNVLAWQERPRVVQNLFNPAFCGLLLWEAIYEYNDTGMDLALAHLILPMSLHRGIRQALPSSVRTTLTNWIHNHPEGVVLLPTLVREMTGLTSSGLLWCITSNAIDISASSGRLTATSRPPEYGAVEDDQILEVSHCVRKAGFLGKWFSRSGSTAVIYALIGVRP